LPPALTGRNRRTISMKPIILAAGLVAILGSTVMSANPSNAATRHVSKSRTHAPYAYGNAYSSPGYGSGYYGGQGFSGGPGYSGGPGFFGGPGYSGGGYSGGPGYSGGGYSGGGPNYYGAGGLYYGPQQGNYFPRKGRLSGGPNASAESAGGF
jgi:hypothetical protein